VTGRVAEGSTVRLQLELADGTRVEARDLVARGVRLGEIRVSVPSSLAWVQPWNEDAKTGSGE
jgi:hypothetical protein